MRVPPSSSDRSLQLCHYTYLQKGFLAVSLPLHSFYQAPDVPRLIQWSIGIILEMK